VHTAFYHLFHILLRLGAAGLLVLGVLDSSFLFLPFGNDLLVTALTIAHRNRLPLFAIAAACGSSLGVSLMDLLVRKGGELGLRKVMSKRRFEFLKSKMTKRVGIPVALACIAPPPFPFTPVVAAASAFNYPRSRLLGIVFLGRTVRFLIVGYLAIRFGQRILRIARTDEFLVGVGFLTGFSIVGSVFSIRRWIRQSRSA
jgi:membrane protein YqaA with SNARE-associated domain